MGLGFFFEQTPLRMLGFNFGMVWALFWIMIGVLLLQRKRIFLGILVTLCGIMSFAGSILNINFGAWFVPVIIIAFGIRIIFKPEHSSTTGDTIGTSVKSTSNQDYINESVVFGGLEKQYTSQNFKGGKVDCVFSGMTLDLRKVKIAKDGAELEINAVFGGGEILVDPKTRIISQGTGVFGGWSNKFSSSADKNEDTLTLKGSAVFGGVEVKN